jgi:hypothetical protein
MASLNKPAHSASKSRRGRSLGIALSALLSCSLIAGCAWGLALTLGAMHEAARTLSEAKISLAMPSHRKATVAVEGRPERRVKVAKFSRLSKPSESEIRRKQLTVVAIRMAYQRTVAAQLALAEENRKAGKAKIAAALALAKSSVEQEEKISGKPSLVTALAEDVPTRDIPPFGLVLTKPETEEDAALPSEIPLPEARPLIETVDSDQNAADEKPVARKNRDDKDAKEDVAYAKPERSLLGDLFRRKAGDTAWPG